MPRNNNNRSEEIVRAQEDADSWLCFWVVFAVIFIVFVALLAGASHPSPHLHHHNDGGWHHTNDNDDDNDDDHTHIIVIQQTPEMLGSSAHASMLAPDTQTNDNNDFIYADVLDTDYIGSHPKFMGCVSDRHRTDLTFAAQATLSSKDWPDDVVPPTAFVEFDERAGTIEFRIDAPYFSQDALYLASFEPFDGSEEVWHNKQDLLHKPGTCQSAPKLEESGAEDSASHYHELWAHAPNSAYDLQRLPAHIARRGAHAMANDWKTCEATASCARIELQLSATADSLRECTSGAGERRALIKFDSSADVAAVSGTLWLNLLWPKTANRYEDGVDVMRWPFAFVLYVDTFESKLSIVDVPGNASAKLHKVPSTDTTPRMPGTVAQNIEKVKQIATQKVTTNDADAINAIDLQLGLLQWNTFTTLAHSWFEPARDVDVYGGAEHLIETDAQKRRALRLLFTTTNAADLGQLMQNVQYKEKNVVADADEAYWQRRVLQEAAKMTPVFNLIGIVPSLSATAGSAAVDTDEYGHFSVLEADFVRNARDRHVECAVHGTEIECHRNWTLVLTPKSSELYQDSFEVRMCDSATLDSCSVSQPAHRVRVDLAITDPSQTLLNEVSEIQIQLSSHLKDGSAKELGETPQFLGGDRVCIQSFAVGSAQTMQNIDLRTVAAWTCVADKPDNEKNPAPAPKLPARKELHKQSAESDIQVYLMQHAEPNTGCEVQKHHIQLFGSADKQEQRIARRIYNVTVHEPGTYGTWSSVVCFDASSIFIDNKKGRVNRITQYYQTEVVAVPTEKRRHLKNEKSAPPLHRTFSSFARAATLTEQTSAAYHDTAMHRAQCVQNALSDQFETLTSPQLGRMLRKLDNKGKIRRFAGISFKVQPESEEERRAMGVVRDDALWVLLLVGIAGTLIGIIVVFIVITWRSKNPKKDEKQKSDATAAVASATENEDEEDSESF